MVSQVVVLELFARRETLQRAALLSHDGVQSISIRRRTIEVYHEVVTCESECRGYVSPSIEEKVACPTSSSRIPAIDAPSPPVPSATVET